jgi:hypothetical protein
MTLAKRNFHFPAIASAIHNLAETMPMLEQPDLSQ